jgi:hypothetical protein
VDDTSLSATGTEIELSSLRRKGLGIDGEDLLELLQDNHHQEARVHTYPVFEVPHDVAQDGEVPIALDQNQRW